MNYPSELIPATWIKRYKRFLVDIAFSDGTTSTAHCPNTGTMLGINTPGSPCLVLRSDNPKRKLGYTLEAVQADGIWVGAHPIRANAIAREAFESGLIQDLEGIVDVRGEVRYGVNSRADWVVEVARGPRWVIEVKSASMKQGRVSMFPDAKTAWGLKHLNELIEVVREGQRAMMLFVATRHDVQEFAPASSIDPAYAARLADAANAGVVLRALTSRVSPTQMVPERLIPVRL